jgi:hypothetical protein
MAMVNVALAVGDRQYDPGALKRTVGAWRLMILSPCILVQEMLSMKCVDLG